jgi:hypothetical protein
MSPEKVDKILEKIKEKLLSKKVPDDSTGKVSFNLQTGGISGNIKIELTL